MTAMPHRLNTFLLVLILVVGVAIVGMLASGARGGPLDPPGPPASTSGVREPGTPITSIPYTITRAGYYYLTDNLVAASDNQSGISIAADDVTLDMKGFTLTGSNKTGTAIAMNLEYRTNLTNGTIDDWGVGLDA